MSRTRKFLLPFPILIGGILLLALTLRLLFAGTLPIAMNNDEIDFIVQAKSVYYTFTDLHASWNPLSLQPFAKEAKSEILYLILAPIFGPLPLSLITVRIPYILINIALIGFIYIFMKRFFSEGMALSVSFIGALNPWLLFLSRTAFESHPALLFYLIGMVILVSLQGKKLFFALPFFFLGFYSYMGAKIIFLPLIFSTSIFAWYLNKKRNRNLYLFFSLVCLIFFASFLMTLMKTSSHNRVNEFSFFSDKIASAVNTERQASIIFPGTQVFSNKITIGGREAIERYFGAFSFDMLFTQGDPNGLYGFWDHGLFYYTDIILVFLGFVFLYRKNKTLFYYLFSLMLIGALPSALSQVDVSYVHRANLTLLMLIVFTGIGLYALLDFLRKKPYGNILMLGVLLLMLLECINFYHVFLFRNPIYNSLQGAYENRIIARYAELTMQQNRPVIILADNREALLKSYLFYTNSLNRSTIHAVQKSFQNESPRFKTITYETACPKEFDKNKTYILFSIKCSDQYVGIPYHAIPILKDGSPIYNIYNDQLCTKVKLRQYPESFPLSMFSVEKLTPGTFCERFITNPNPL